MRQLTLPFMPVPRTPALEEEEDDEEEEEEEDYGSGAPGAAAVAVQ